MKWIKYLLVLLLVASVGFVYLANRDMTRIYGGLTQRVDPSSFTPYNGPLVINNVNVLTPDSERFLANQTVAIEDGVIVSVGQEPEDLGRYRAVDGSGKYLIPGLADTHVHLFKSPNDLLLYAANGVTQIRELIGEEDHLEWRAQIQNGQIGPDMFIASPRIGSFEGMEGMFMEWSQGFLNINNAIDAEKEVRRLHNEGYDAVKIYSQINKETYHAVAKTAKALGMRVVGHVPWSVELSDVYVEHESIAHLEELMNALNREFGKFKAATADEFLAFVEQRSDEVAQNLFDNDITVSTTLWLVESFIGQKFDLDNVLREVELEYENPGISEWTPRVPQGGLGWLPGVNRYQLPGTPTEEEVAWRSKYWQTYAAACRIILMSLVENNVKIMTGTDANLPPTVPGFSLHDEFVSLNSAGMSESQVLKAATSQPADWLGNNAGRIQPGKKANLVLLDENPLEDIRNTRSIRSVVLHGKLLDRSMLNDMLHAVKEANDASRKKDISVFLK